MPVVKRLTILFLPYVIAYMYTIFIWKVQTNKELEMGLAFLIGANGILPYIFFIIPCYYIVRFVVERWVKNHHIVWLMISCIFVALLHVILVGIIANDNMFNQYALLIIWIPSFIISGTFILLNALFRYRTE